LKKKKVINLEEVYLDQLAFDSNYQNDEPEQSDDKLNTYSSLVQALVKENKSLKQEVERLTKKINEKNNEYDEASKECVKLHERLKELEEKLAKEQKRANILEVENTRNLDELKTLKKERNELLAKSQKSDTTAESKFMNFLKNLFGRSKSE
jgi:chromosome segregation ATPase